MGAVGSSLDNHNVCSFAIPSHKGLVVSKQSGFVVTNRSMQKSFGARFVQPMDTDFRHLDRSGLMKSASKIIQDRMDTSPTPHKCLDEMDPNSIVKHMRTFDETNCLDLDLDRTSSCLYHATEALNVWRRVNGLKELDTSHIQD